MNRGSKSADEYIKALKKSASEEEFKTMMTQPTDEMKMTAFYRYWVGYIQFFKNKLIFLVPKRSGSQSDGARNCRRFKSVRF